MDTIFKSFGMTQQGERSPGLPTVKWTLQTLRHHINGCNINLFSQFSVSLSLAV